MHIATFDARRFPQSAGEFLRTSAEFRCELLNNGVAFIRGVEVDSLGTLVSAALTSLGSLFEYDFQVTPRRELGNGFLSATEVPPMRPVRFHNECSYLPIMPRYLLFACARASDSGGRTLLSSSAQITANLPSDVRCRLLRRQILYRWMFADDSHLSRKVVGKAPDEVLKSLELCSRRDVAGRLIVESRRPATLSCPSTGADLWANHIWALHASAIPAALLEVCKAENGSDFVPHDVMYDDGTPISQEDIEQIGEVYKQFTVYINWEPGDIAVIDNLMWAHAREPFVGARELLVQLFCPIRP